MEEEEDPWNARIEQTGCAKENEALQICRYDTGDWRKCVKEMKEFRECWDRNRNAQRVATVDSSTIDPSADSTPDHNLTKQHSE